MLPRFVLLLAMFSNFFGFYIIDAYSKSIGYPFFHPFRWNDYSWSSILELSLLFFSCALVLFLFFRSGAVVRKSDFVELGVRGVFYYFCIVFFFLVSLYSLVTVNFSLNIFNRGVGQFDRDILSSISRASVLLVPLLICFRVAYFSHRLARLSCVFLVFCVSINAVSMGDRRILVYFVLSYFLILLRERALGLRVASGISGRMKVYLFSGVFFFLVVGAYLVRALGAGDAGMGAASIFMLRSTIGALGVGAILSEVKLIVYEGAGYLYGLSFLNYFVFLLVPSFIIYAFGGSEFYARGAYLFNEKFNDNPNVGYDFMMVADFFWNFSYFGYFLYLMLFVFVSRFALVRLYSDRVLPFCAAVIVFVFFVAGQRSDFGFFIKSSFYCLVFLYFVGFLFDRRVGNVKDGGF